MNSIPSSMQHILWSKDIRTLNEEIDAPYIIHQILSHGTLEHIQWLFQKYSQQEIKHVFLSHPYKDYRASRFFFITRFFLDIPNQSINTHLYVANTPRDIRYQ